MPVGYPLDNRILDKVGWESKRKVWETGGGGGARPSV